MRGAAFYPFAICELRLERDDVDENHPSSN